MARAEAQRAADAGALAGAKMLVDIGVTTDPCNSALATTAQALAQTQGQNVAAQDLVAGQAPSATATISGRSPDVLQRAGAGGVPNQPAGEGSRDAPEPAYLFCAQRDP